MEDDEELGLPPRPKSPELGDCCGSGCTPCVYDIYYKQLEEWENLRDSFIIANKKKNRGGNIYKRAQLYRRAYYSLSN